MTNQANSKFKIQNAKLGKGKAFLSLLVALYIMFPQTAGADAMLDSLLKDGFGIRPIGMGGAFTAVADDGNAVYYNPAAASSMKPHYLRGYMDSNTDVYNKSDCYAVMTEMGGMAYWNLEDKAGSKADVTAFSFGTRGDNGVSWGITHKNISWTNAITSGRGWTYDVGFKFPISTELSAGVLLQDFIKNTAPVATSIRMGMAMYPMALSKTVFAAEGEFRNLKAAKGADVYMHYGIETSFIQDMTLRAGWSKDRFTAGATATFPYSTIDYAIIINPEVSNTHMLGFRLGEI